MPTGTCNHPSHPRGPGRIWPVASWVAGLFGTAAVADLGHNLSADAVLFVLLVVGGVAALLDPHKHRAVSIEPELRRITGRPLVSQARLLELEDELLAIDACGPVNATPPVELRQPQPVSPARVSGALRGSQPRAIEGNKK